MTVGHRHWLLEAGVLCTPRDCQTVKLQMRDAEGQGPLQPFSQDRAIYLIIVQRSVLRILTAFLTPCLCSAIEEF
jgi:hypothetical protein